MPLKTGKSDKTFGYNVKVEEAAGKPPKQAEAIAYSQKEKAEHKAKGGIVGHKLVADNHDHFVIQHPDGSHFRVAKAGLSAPMVAHIAKMPRVQYDDEGTTPEDLDSESSYDPNGSSDPHYGATDGEAPAAQALPSSGFGDGAPAPSGIPPGTPPPAPEAVSGEGNSFGVMASDTNSAPAPSATTTPQTGTQSAGFPDLGGQYLKDTERAAGEEKAANNAKAGAEKLVNDAEAESANNYVGQQAAANDAYQTKHAELDAKNDELAQNIANSKIDPNHLWSSASTGSKLAMLAGVLISGFGANAGQGNMALNVINKAIDNDIDAQKTNLASKQNLLHYNLERTRDLTAAQAETRLNLLATFKGTVARAAAKQGGAVAQANANALNAQIDMQMAGIKHQIAVQHAMMGMMGGGSAPAQGQDPNDIDPQRLRSALLLGQQGFPTGIPKEQAAEAMKEYGTFKRQQAATQTLADNFRIMATNHGIGIGTGPAASEAKKRWESAATVVGMTVDHELAGRVTHDTLQAIKDANTPRWGDDDATVAQKFRNIDDAIKGANAKDANGYGTLMTYGFLSPNNPHIAPSSAIVKQTRKR